MFLLDEVTVGISAVVLFIAVISPFVNLLVSRLRDSSADEEDEGETAVEAQNPGISVVMTVDDELEDLKVSLPALLKQKYEGDFQIIVVACGNNPVIEDTLKMYSEDKHLYTTFIPASSRYMSRKKLAVTLGVKAAKYEWIMMTDVDCCPVSETWLAEMSGNCTEDNGLVVGFSSLRTTTRLRDVSTMSICSTASSARHRRETPGAIAEITLCSARAVSSAERDTTAI